MNYFVRAVCVYPVALVTMHGVTAFLKPETEAFNADSVTSGGGKPNGLGSVEASVETL